MSGILHLHLPTSTGGKGSGLAMRPDPIGPGYRIWKIAFTGDDQFPISHLLSSVLQRQGCKVFRAMVLNMGLVELEGIGKRYEKAKH